MNSGSNFKNLVDRISGYSNIDYVSKFNEEVKNYYKDYGRSLIVAISEMTANIGVKEYERFKLGEKYLTNEPINFIRYALSKNKFELLDKIWIKTKLEGARCSDYSDCEYLPNKILNEIITYDPSRGPKTMFYVLEDKEIESFQ